MVIEAVLFDYSGVLTTGLALPAADLPFDRDAAFVEMVAALTGTDEHPWHRLERGELSLDDYLVYVESRVPGAGVLFEIDSEHNVMGNLELLEHRLDLVAEVKATGRRVGLVTNNVAEWQGLWRPRLPTGLFDITIDSAEVGCRKPEPEIYRLAMTGLGLDDPARIVFIDDFEWNVAGATAVGMVGLHCTAATDLRSELLELLALLA